jgi:nucleotide-binding universal stress UspA family protein
MHVLVAVEELDARAAHHLEVGRHLARAFGGGLIAFHAAGQGAGAAEVQAAGQSLAGLAADAGAEVQAAGQGGRSGAIVDAASRHQCELIVMGTEGADPVISRFLDSTAHKVLEAGAYPVLIVHPERGLRAQGGVVLVAVSDPVFSARAIQHGLHMAQALQARVKVVHVGSREEDPVATLLHSPEHPSQAIVAAAAQPFRDAGLEVEGQVVPNYKGVADELAHVADLVDADVIVVGSSGKLDLGGWLLGSIAEAVLHRSQRPVLVVPSLTL